MLGTSGGRSGVASLAEFLGLAAQTVPASQPSQQQDDVQAAADPRRAPHPRVRNTASSGATAVTNNRRSFPFPHRYGDPFLPCSSRHFHIAGASTQHRRGAARRRTSLIRTMGPTSPRRPSSVGGAAVPHRRGRSAGPVVGDTGETNVTSASTPTTSTTSSTNQQVCECISFNIIGVNQNNLILNGM